MSQAEHYQASKACRDTAREGYSCFFLPSGQPLLVEAWDKMRDGSQRLAFPDRSLLVLKADGQEEATWID